MLPIKFIKIEGEFITNIRSRPIGETIVKSIHYGQGYGIHRPAPL
ncbi:hypothetical protein [Pseudidiomarina donghaiensis]|nr:hypothetical protein [Pseudidiomarina donghaiensis]